MREVQRSSSATSSRAVRSNAKEGLLGLDLVLKTARESYAEDDLCTSLN